MIYFINSYVQDCCFSCNSRGKWVKVPLNTQTKKTRLAQCKVRGAETVQTSAEREEMREKEASQIWPPYSELECNSEGEWGVETWSHIPNAERSDKRKNLKRTRTRNVSWLTVTEISIELFQSLTQQITVFKRFMSCFFLNVRVNKPNVELTRLVN